MSLIPRVRAAGDLLRRIEGADRESDDEALVDETSRERRDELVLDQEAVAEGARAGSL